MDILALGKAVNIKTNQINATNSSTSGQIPSANANGTFTWVNNNGGDYTLPIATESVIGGIKSSTDILVNNSTGVATVSTGVSANNILRLDENGKIPNSPIPDIIPQNYLYVAKSGDDTNGTGSANRPYLTVSKAISVASVGTTVYVYPGTYTENVTFKANVNLSSPIKFGVYITGNHTANFNGTTILDNITLNSSSGNTLYFTGTNAQNLQLINSSVNSTTGDAINWDNTNASSKIYFETGTVNVSTSGISARCFYSTSTAKGSFIADTVSFKVDNLNNVCIALNGSIAFTHTSDTINGQVTVSNTATATISQIAITTSSVPVLVTNSTGMTTFASVIINTTSTPAITGAGLHTFVAVLYANTGVGGASTLNGGIGSISLPMGSIKLRDASLLPASQISAGQNSGGFEYDGTDLYFTKGTTRYKVTMVAV